MLQSLAPWNCENYLEPRRFLLSSASLFHRIVEAIIVAVMIISLVRKYIFVHIPKTTRTAMALALEQRAMKDDMMVGDIPRAFPFILKDLCVTI